MMNRWPLRTRLLFIVLGPCLLMFMSFVTLTLHTRYQELDEQLQKRGAYMVKQLAPACEYGVISGNTDALKAQLQPLVKEPDVVFIAVHDLDDNILLKLNSPLGDAEQYSLSLFEADIYQEELALEAGVSRAGSISNGARLGRVVLGLSDESSQHELWRVVGYRSIIASFCLLLGTLGALLVAQSVTRDFQALGATLRGLKSGDYSQRSSLDGNTDITALQTDINQLAESLQNSSNAERQYTDSLIRARESADAANRAKSQFLANMSHELRTPMNGTLGMLQLLGDSALSSQQTEYVKAAVESTEHLLTVVNDILDFSKIDEGKLQLEQLYFDLHELVSRVVSNFQKDAAARGLTLRQEFINHPGPHEVLGDPTRVRQILINLIGNALKFTEVGTINVRCEWRQLNEESLEIVISVVDTGIGIDAERLATIFQPFTQIDSSMSRRHSGAGLGLAICKQLATLMQGMLSASSRQGYGSRFDLRLPMPFRRLNRAQQDANGASPAVLMSQLHGHVLLAEDNIVNQMVVQGFLSKMGLTVELASDGEQAVALYRDKAFDLVIMDCQMPVMDGYEATGQLRAIERDSGRRTAIIALTAHTMQGDRERCLAAGMDDYLAKPVKKEDLHATLQRWLSQKTQR